MQFLVEIAVDFPAELRDPDSERRKALLASELGRGVDLYRAGAIVRIWRVPGELRNIGIWEAKDATELHDLLSSLPLFPWIRVSVTPMAVHPIERELGQ